MTARTPADDAGEVTALRAELAQVRDDYRIECEARERDWEQRNEARAEADRLRAECSELEDLCHAETLRADEAEDAEGKLRVTLGKVAELTEKPTVIVSTSSLHLTYDEIRKLVRAADPVSCTCSPESFVANQWHHFPDCQRADPVSLADVRETPNHEAHWSAKDQAWCTGRGDWCNGSEAVTDRG